MARGWGLGTVIEAAVVVAIVAVVAGQLLGQPVLLGYVTSGSMAPTMETGDGFVAIPAAVAGEVEEGDVIVFQAESLHGGGLTTHRVVDVTDRGYITKGDANPFTDQDNDEPPVKDAQIVATAWQPGGGVLVIPELGTVVMGTQSVIQSVQRRAAAALGTRSLLGVQGLAYLLFALSIVAYVLDVWLGGSSDRRRDRQRERDSGTSARLLVAIFAAVIVLAATAAMVVPAGSQEFGVVSAESDAPGPRVIEQGTSESVDYPVSNGGLVPIVSYFEGDSERVSVEPTELRVPARESVNATLTLSAPPETGYYRQYLVEHRYLAILPQSTIRALYEVHPWLPIAVIDGLLGGSFYVVGIALAGTGRIRSRSRETPGGVFDRLG
ncbi:signal peptidase I [Halorientalis regularis]|uniref:Signal peptidase, endoplasmic reticulum-type n=1 Tax=Halorientalis regularis TaxID=660518 RepID=A0A1G7SDU9_9EURY|nr:signal peptidase I [Halorientalis regularis]SDG21255.1 signal peptidase, endoplasmic reticulum-type [Halorientalis regularis]